MLEEKRYGNIRFLIKFPNGFSDTQHYPVLLFLHGAGTKGNDIQKLYEHPFFTLTNKHSNFPFVVVVPLCDRDTWFDMFESIISFTHYIYESPFTDKKSFYAMGASMGAYGVWQLAMSCPELFAAIVPICGGGMYWNAYRLKNIPVWAFHGDSDEVVLTRESTKMVESLNASGGSAKLTVYKNCGHDAWSETFANVNVFKWLLTNSKSSITNCEAKLMGRDMG